MLSDWLNKLAPLSQPVRQKKKTIQNKTNSGLLALYVFQRLTLITCVFFNLFMLCFVSVVIG